MVLTDVKSINKPFDVMTYLFGVTKHIKYVISMMDTLKWTFQENFQI